jgi:ElaB/YqjD/DUF883 family membrane-anchored ribosome-binding protein
MSPDNPQSGKRGTRTGSRPGNEKSFDQNAQSSPSDLGNTTADPLRAGFGATEFGTTTGAPNYGTTGSVGSGRRGGDGDQQTSGILNQVRDKATSQLNEQKTRATDSLGSVAQAVRQSTHHLREQQYDTVAQFVERAADQIERFSNHLRERDLNDLVQEAQRFARQQPAVFIGSSFAAGMLAARFIKASRPERSFDDRGYSGYGVTAGGTDTAFNRGGAIDRDTTPGSGTYRTDTSFGGSTGFGGGDTSFDRDTSFGTSTNRPGDVTGRGEL